MGPNDNNNHPIQRELLPLFSRGGFPAYFLETARIKVINRDNDSSPADDLRQLADHLNVPHFYVAGMSGGGPYALAAAHYLQGRVKGATVNCSAASVGASRDSARNAVE